MFDRFEGERDAVWIISALRRRWWVIALTAIVASVSAYVLSSQQTKQYQATAALLFLNSTLDQELTGKQVLTPSIDPTRQAATNQALVELPTVSRMVAAQLGLPSSRIREDLSFGSDATSDVMTVSATDHSPEMAARIANAYVQTYIQFRKSGTTAQLVATENLINSKLAAIPPSRRSGGVAQALIANRNELDLVKSTLTGDAQVVQTATVPRSPSSPHPKRDAALGLLLGLLLGSAFALLLERRDRRIKTIEEVESIYGVPVLGTVPESKALRSGGSGTGHDEDAFLMIRAQLRYVDVDRQIKRVMVTSAASAEGKSVISLNLARAAARMEDRQVLLIEADLRRPTLHTLMGRPHVAGLVELLGHSQDLETGLRELVVTPDQVPESDHPARLDVLLAGATPPNPAALLESRRMRALLEAVDAIYDTVIIDTPPIAVLSDAIPLLRLVDGVLVISRMGLTRRDQATRLIKRCRSLDAHILGVVVNSFSDVDDADYGYYEFTGAGSADSPAGRSRRGRPRVARTS